MKFFAFRFVGLSTMQQQSQFNLYNLINRNDPYFLLRGQQGLLIMLSLAGGQQQHLLSH